MSRARAGAARVAGLVLACLAALLVLPLAAAGAHAATAAPQRSVMVLLDVNESLAGARIAAERTTVLRYARALPADVRIGLITFSDGWELNLRPTTDRGKLASALSASRLSGFTSAGIAGALSGANAAVERLGAGGQGRVLALSDGELVAGKLPTPALPTDVVTWRYESDDNVGAIRALAAASGGRVVSDPARVAVLAAAFPALARTPSPVPSAASPSAARHAIAVPRSSLSLIAVLALVFIAGFVLSLLVIRAVSPGTQRRRLVAEIERYGPRHAPAPASDDAGDGAVARTAVSLAAQLLASSNVERGLAQRLDLAGISRKPAEWVLMGAGLGAALAAVLTLLTGNVLVGLLIGVAVGWAGMRLIVDFRIRRRRAAFRDQLPDVLQFVAGSLRSGFSLAQALDAVVREDTQPAAGEFFRALAEARVGVDLDTALEGIAKRMASVDLQWTIIAIRIQREVGGNLAEVLSTTVATMRERAFLHRHVRALSAEGRLSAYILIALPLAMGAWLFITDRNYLRPIYTTAFGLLMLFVALVLFAVGVVWMRAVVKVEV